MTTRHCPLCGAELARDVEVCRGCHQAWRVTMRGVPELLRELDVQITRQASGTAGGSPPCPDGCLHDADSPTCRQGVRPELDERASIAAADLRTCLHGWYRVWAEETTVRPEHRRIVDRLASSASGQAAMLRSVSNLPSRPWAADVIRETTAAVDDGWRAVDRAPDITFVGRCATPDCGRAVYAVTGHRIGRCEACHATWGVEGSRAIMLAALPGMSDRQLTKPELAELLGIPIGTLHRWSSEGRMVASAVNAKGQPMYAAGPVIDAARSGIAPQRQQVKA